VAIDTELTAELINEGYVRELVSKIQTMRKEAGFDVVDHIRVAITGSKKLNKLVASHGADILADVLGDSMEAELEGYTKKWDINGEAAEITVAKV
jgi:isoleucyl-tRNA synthetase